jgi:hypothetical protein
MMLNKAGCFNFDGYTEPFFWWHEADDLKAAADALLTLHSKAARTYFSGMKKDGIVRLNARQRDAERHLRFNLLYLFMLGLAFENAAKGALIGRNKAKWVSGGKLKFTKHDVVWLFDQLGIAVDDIERDFLKRVSDNVLWAGRYPTSIKESGMIADVRSNGAYTWPGNFLKGDSQLAEHLWSRLICAIQADATLPKYKSIDPRPRHAAQTSRVGARRGRRGGLANV